MRTNFKTNIRVGNEVVSKTHHLGFALKEVKDWCKVRAKEFGGLKHVTVFIETSSTTYLSMPGTVRFTKYNH